MKTFSLHLVSLLALVGAALMSCAPQMATAAESVVQNSKGVFVKGGVSNIYAQTSVCYSTDGNGNFVPCKVESGGVGILPARLNTASTNVTPGASVALVTSMPSAATQVSVYNGSSQELILETGTTGAAVKVLELPAGVWTGPVHLYMASGSALSLIAASSTASSGVVMANFLQ